MTGTSEVTGKVTFDSRKRRREVSKPVLSHVTVGKVECEIFESGWTLKESFWVRRGSIPLGFYIVDCTLGLLCRESSETMRRLRLLVPLLRNGLSNTKVRYWLWNKILDRTRRLPVNHLKVCSTDQRESVSRTSKGLSLQIVFCLFIGVRRLFETGEKTDPGS